MQTRKQIAALVLLELVLARLYQNVREIIHEWYELRRSRAARLATCTTASLIVDAQELLESIVVNHHV